MRFANSVLFLGVNVSLIVSLSCANEHPKMAPDDAEQPTLAVPRAERNAKGTTIALLSASDDTVAVCKGKDPAPGYVIVGQTYSEDCRHSPPPTIELNNAWSCRKPHDRETIPKDPCFIPDGWVIIGEGSGVFPPRTDGKPNAWIIKRADANVGGELLVCWESPIPTGYSDTGKQANNPSCPSRHDSQGYIVPNAKRIRRDR